MTRRVNGGYMPQLDGLRALAILAVMVWHYLEKGSPIRDSIAWGWVGVRLFFVLSGFLITGILLRSRAEMDAGRLTLGTSFIRFYARRSLRIFPIYYLYIVATAIAFPPMRETLIWFVLYAQNFMFAINGRLWPNGHLWTLAVEEQFYLFWPLLVLLLPRKWLSVAVVGLIAASPLFRLLAPMVGIQVNGAMTLLPSNLDTLAIGSLLAMVWAGQAPRWCMSRTVQKAAGWVGVALLVSYVALHNAGFSRTLEYGDGTVDRILFGFADLGAALVFVHIIDRAAQGFSGLGGALLASSPLRFIGKVSYGLYVYHVHAPTLFMKVAPESLVQLIEQQAAIRFTLFFAISMLVATASWYLFEAPVLRLKRYFEPAR